MKTFNFPSAKVDKFEAQLPTNSYHNKPIFKIATLDQERNHLGGGGGALVVLKGVSCSSGMWFYSDKFIPQYMISMKVVIPLH